MLDIAKYLQPLKNKLMLIVGRCILTAINNSGKTQKVACHGLDGENFSDMERMENYGFSSVPRAGSEGVMVFPNANRGNGVIVVMADREARVKTLTEGDVCMFDYRGTMIIIDSLGITLKTGDAGSWIPNNLAIDPFSGIPHGGVTGGIIKLKGA